MLDRLAALIYRRRRRFLWGSLAVVLVAGFFGGPVFGLLDSSGDFDDPNSEAPLASRDIARATKNSAAPDLVALVRLGAPADSAAGQRKLDRVEEALQVPGMKLIRYERGGDRSLVSKDGRSSYVAASFPENGGGVLDTVRPRLEAIPGVTIGGNDIARDQVGDQVSEDIARAELLAFPILFLLSLFVFRSVVAALLPLAVGGATIMLSFLVMRFVNATIEPMSIYALNLITGLGLGLAIDYSLFVVSRFREELERGLDTGAALRATMTTAGRTVLFSSVTVAAALASLLVFPLRFLYSMGVGGLVLRADGRARGDDAAARHPRRARPARERAQPAALAGVDPPRRVGRARRLLVPPVAHDHAPPGAGRDRRGHAADRARDPVLVHQVHRRRRGRAPARPLRPRGRRRARQGVPAQPRHPGRSSLRAAAPRIAPRSSATRSGWGRSAAWPASRACNRADGLYRIDLVARGRPLGEQAKEVVRDVRAIESPVPVRVGGVTAAFLDQQKALSDSLPLALGILAVTTLVILFLMTGSVVLPVKALVMNLLTLSAAFGLLVLIFQDGHLEGLLGLHEPGRAGVEPAGAAVRGRVRALDRLRRLPAHAHQGGARQGREQRGGGRARARADGPHRHLRRAAVRDRHRRVRDLADHLHQAARGRDRARGADRRDDRARAARPVADAAAGRPQLVGAAAAGPAVPADRAVGDGAGVTNRFDADTALEGAGGRWRAEVKEHWFVQRGPNGGLVAALATRALVDLAGAEQSPRSLSLHYLAPPEAGELEVRAAVERAGRTTTFASIRVLQGGTTVAYGLGACSAWREGQPSWDVLERPDVPPPAEIASLDTDGAFPFLANYEMRPLSAPHNGAWMRTAQSRPADPVLLAALTDAWIPAAFAHMEEPNFVPTIDLTIHWRAAPGVPAGDHPWVLGLFSTRLGAGGTWEEDGELWSEDGVLLVHSRQLAIVRNPR